jgi:hypothetical protein
VEKKEIILNGKVIAYSLDYKPIFSKDEILESVNSMISKMTHVKSDGYMFSAPKKEFEDIYKFCSEVCKSICDENSIEAKRFTLHKWISVLRSNPVQPMELDPENNEPTYHNHKDIALRSGNTVPTYSFVFYLQMPNNLSGIDGHILLKDYEGNVLKYLPVENEVLIFKSDIPHAPIHAKNSTHNRIVLAGDFRIDNSKNIKTLI